MSDANSEQKLRPLPYHEAVRDYLRSEEPEVWDWFASHGVRAEQAEAVRFDLLKSTYRVDRETKPHWYAAAEETAEKLSLAVPVTIYQAQNPMGLNASLAYVPNEAHLVLHGPVGEKLTAAEFRALVAHELSHLLLWQAWDGEYLIVDQLLSALTHDSRAETSHFAAARLFALYNEVFCDRGSLLVTEDLLPVVAMLVKVSTELEDVSAASYLRQADEIFNKGTAKAAELTHPEAFIRARALKLWADGDTEADRKIELMIEGTPALDELDLLAQKNVAGWTRRLIDTFLNRKWMQTEPVLAHARLFFDDYVPAGRPADDRDLAEAIKTQDKPLQDYYCYVLLDFVTADRDLEEMPLAAALVLTDKLGLKDRFMEIAKRELRLRKKQLNRLDQQKDELLAKVNE